MVSYRAPTQPVFQQMTLPISATLLFLSLCHLSALSQTRTWTRIVDPMGPRTGQSAFDSFRGVAVHVSRNNENFAETWEWNGSNWRFLTSSGPTGRTQMRIVYDSNRRVCVLFGGANASLDQFFPDTWEWDGVSWAQRPVAGPAARYGHAMCFDSARGVTVLFGGRGSSSSLGDTWEWDGISWQLRATSGPVPREGSAFAFDANRGKSVLFSGSGSSIPDTWEWDGVEWVQRAVTGPPRRSYSAMAFDNNRAKCVLYGGRSSANTSVTFDDCWEWDGVTWVQVAGATFGPRTQHSMVFDSTRGSIMLYGGGKLQGTSWLFPKEAWTLNGESWSLQFAAPMYRTGARMAYDSRRRVMVMFGGEAMDGVYLNETWEWDGVRWHLRITPGPAGRVHPGMAYDSNRGVVVMHAASHPNALQWETWEWDGSTWSLRDTSYRNPSPTLAFDERRGVMVSAQTYNSPTQTWEWDGSIWTQRVTPHHPGSLIDGAMVYDSWRGVSVLYGANGPNGPQISEFDGADWTMIDSGDPGTRNSAQMCYNTERRESTFCGSANDGSDRSEEIWGWNGFRWRVETIPFGPVRDAAFGYDHDAKASYLFGGSGAPYYVGDFWKITDIPCDSDIDGDYDVDIQDLATLLGHFGQVEGGSLEDGDLDGDGDIDIQDLALLLARFGQPC